MEGGDLGYNWPGVGRKYEQVLSVHQRTNIRGKIFSGISYNSLFIIADVISSAGREVGATVADPTSPNERLGVKMCRHRPASTIGRRRRINPTGFRPSTLEDQSPFRTISYSLHGICLRGWRANDAQHKYSGRTTVQLGGHWMTTRWKSQSFHSATGYAD
jgi:hypothetical protein